MDFEHLPDSAPHSVTVLRLTCENSIVLRPIQQTIQPLSNNPGTCRKMHSFGIRMQIAKLHFDKPAPLGGKSQQAARQRANVRRIVIKRIRSNEHVLRIRRLHDQTPARPQNTQCLINKCQELWKREMLHYMKSGNRAKTGIGGRMQEGQGVGTTDVEPLLPANFEHSCVAVDALRFESMVAQGVQPLAAPAANVENRHTFGAEGALSQVRNILRLNLLDILLRPAEDVLECEILVVLRSCYVCLDRCR